MRRQVRQKVFETNSSSVHSLTLCSLEDWNRWERGEVYFDGWDNAFVEVEKDDESPDVKEENNKAYHDEHIFQSPDDYFDYYKNEYYVYDDQYVTPGGETVVAFGYYGND